jgi:hypothetical protein
MSQVSRNNIGIGKSPNFDADTIDYTTLHTLWTEYINGISLTCKTDSQFQAR